MSERNRLLQSIATIIEDYQAGTLPTPTPEHVERWIDQFSGPAQQPILTEMEHVLEKTYFRKSRVRSILKSLIRHAGWTAGNPTAFWRQVHFLDLQPRGNSQRELLALFDAKLQKECGLALADCGRGNKFLYLDDGLFSGGRMKADLMAWIAGPAPRNAELLIAVVALHTQGRFFTERDLNKAIVLSGKMISVNWTRYVQIEDGIFNTNTSDVLRPTSAGSDPAVATYLASLGKAQTWRTGTSVGPNQFFSSNQGREVLEQEFLKMGVVVRARSPYLNDYQRPLGNTTMRTVGFGTLFATYRNCPNNAPLVLWAGDPWYPLLHRVTN